MSFARKMFPGISEIIVGVKNWCVSQFIAKTDVPISLETPTLSTSSFTHSGASVNLLRNSSWVKKSKSSDNTKYLIEQGGIVQYDQAVSGIFEITLPETVSDQVLTIQVVPLFPSDIATSPYRVQDAFPTTFSNNVLQLIVTVDGGGGSFFAGFSWHVVGTTNIS